MSGEIDPRRVAGYHFRARDYSLVDPAFRWVICPALIRFVPRTVAPNLITLVGNMISFAVFAFLLGLSRSSPEWLQAHPWLFLVPAAGIFAYATLDSLDGFQARRIGASGPLGDFIDHWFDAFAAFMIPVGILVSAYRASGVQVLVMTAACVWFYWATIWARKASGVLTLVGNVDAIVFAAGVHLVTAIAGTGIWQRTIQGIPLGDLLFGGILGFFGAMTAWLMLSNRGRRRDFLGVSASLLLVALWAWCAQGQGAVGLVGHPVVPVLMGLIGVRHTGNLLRNDLAGTRERVAEPALFGTQGMLLLSPFLSPRAARADVQIALATALAVAVAVSLVLQFRETTQALARVLGVRVFTVAPAEPAKVPEES
jgi:phosphatidylglycerophosphate synthase